jgi:ElaB/YqjD/DUF883 family membrane-anchored ribosome-binding protein
MDTNTVTERAEEYLQDTGRYVRENPVPLLLGAVAVGFLLGLAARQLDRERKHEPIHDALDEIRSFLKPLTKRARAAAEHSAEVVRDAAGRVREIDVDGYAAPVTGWWRKLWS